MFKGDVGSISAYQTQEVMTLLRCKLGQIGKDNATANKGVFSAQMLCLAQALMKSKKWKEN